MTINYCILYMMNYKSYINYFIVMIFFMLYGSSFYSEEKKRVISEPLELQVVF